MQKNQSGPTKSAKNIHYIHLSADTHDLLRLTQAPNLKNVCIGISNDIFEINVAGWPFLFALHHVIGVPMEVQ